MSPQEARVIEAAIEWTERITNWPGAWGDVEDFELIRSVQALTGTERWDLTPLPTPA